MKDDRFAPHQIAGRFSGDLLALLVPPGTAPPDAGRFRIIHVSGRFLSTDDLTVTSLRREGNAWSIAVDIVRREQPDAPPAARDLYLLLHIHGASTITVHFTGVEAPDVTLPPLT
jgi:hypothetical protein